jgi:tripartite-type tricarboxylate transporter receptor subunit TctC
MGAALGQPMVVENKPGAGGNIASQQVKAATPDGHTLLFHSVAVSVNPSLFRNAGYDLLKDFEPVAMAGVTPNLLFVNPSVKATTLGELIAFARTTPLSYASSGNGTTTHLGAELLFRSLAGVDIAHVPHQPAAAAVAVIGGSVPIGSTSMPPVVPHAKSGKVRPIAVMSLQRSPVLPDVPTVAESGYPGFEASTWFAVFAPAATPQAVLQRLNEEFNRALQSRDITEKFAKQSLAIEPLDRAALRTYIAAEVAKWGKVVRDANIKVD